MNLCSLTDRLYYVGLKYSSLWLLFVADLAVPRWAKVHRHFIRSGLKKNKKSSGGLEAASLVIRCKWLIKSWLAQSTVSLADVAGRTIAVTNAQSCSKAISSFFCFFAAGSQWTVPLLDTPPPLLKPNACHSPCPHQPPAFPHVHKPTHVNTKPKQPTRPWTLETH